MRNHIITKILAIFLCALTLFTAAVSGLSIILLAAMGISDAASVDARYNEEMNYQWQWAGQSVARRYAARKLGGVPEELVYRLYGYKTFSDAFRQDAVFYSLYDENGNMLLSNYSGQKNVTEHTVEVGSVDYCAIAEGPVSAESFEQAVEMFAEKSGVPEPNTGDEDYDPILSRMNALNYSVESFGGDTYYGVTTKVSPAYTVTLYLAPNAMVQDTFWTLARMAWNYRNAMMAVLGVSLVLFALLAVYLCCAAGRNPSNDEVRPRGLNCVPLDLYFTVATGIISLLIFLGAEGAEYLLWQGLVVTLSVYGYAGFLCCLIFVGFCFAFAAQVKVPGYYWLHNSLCGRLWGVFLTVWKFCWGCFVWVVKHLPYVFKKLMLVCWTLIRFAWGLFMSVLLWIKKQFGKFGAMIGRGYRMLPLTWQWLAAGASMPVLLAIAFATRRAFWILISLGLCCLLILYGANCFGTLLKSTKRMRSGDLEIKVDDKLLIGSFGEFAEELNGLADVAVVAAQKQLKSERMKTELITNVSHDIKTPLTSIINYVDLLQKSHTPEEEAMYLEILSRQSARMKKLIEDLLEMSKASTGNMPVDITRVDAVETVNQALGEFSDKLAAADLMTVYHQPQEEIYMNADGRLVWRAMSNVLSNAVKYAMPGTRLYVDLGTMNDKVVISVKNISREQLNVSADELMERFVRGDSSRNTEGSGLGLNIAQSLMQLQHGELQLLVDGDLFKVTLIFPRTEG